MHGVAKDLAGKKFGGKTVLRLLPERKNGLRIWECLCDCGNVCYSNTDCLTNGKAQTCGCGNRTQGNMTGGPLWSLWENMKRRCYSKKCPAYKNYGGRGITICERWMFFPNFFADMFSSYRKGLTLDRIDNNGPYSPENCRWTTMKEQTRNQRTNLVFEFQGKKMIVKDIASALGVPASTLYSQIRRTGKINHESS